MCHNYGPSHQIPAKVECINSAHRSSRPAEFVQFMCSCCVSPFLLPYYLVETIRNPSKIVVLCLRVFNLVEYNLFRFNLDLVFRVFVEFRIGGIVV